VAGCSRGGLRGGISVLNKGKRVKLRVLVQLFAGSGEDRLGLNLVKEGLEECRAPMSIRAIRTSARSSNS
jgi:hypothetical protein